MFMNGQLKPGLTDSFASPPQKADFFFLQKPALSPSAKETMSIQKQFFLFTDNPAYTVASVGFRRTPAGVAGTPFWRFPIFLPRAALPGASSDEMPVLL
jgi:hypothetical protein